MMVKDSKELDDLLDAIGKASESLGTLLSEVLLVSGNVFDESYKALNVFAYKCEKLCLSQKAKDKKKNAETVNSRRREMFKNNKKPKGW